MKEFCEVVEVCPHCDYENVYKVSIAVVGRPIRTCKKCKKKIFICSECEQLNDYDNCDWHENPDGSCECCCGKIPANS